MRSRKGTSYVEVLCALFLFIFAFDFLLQTFTKGPSLQRLADYQHIAFNIASSHIERVRSLSFSDLPSAGELATKVDDEGNANAQGLFNRTTTITPSYGGNALLTEISVEVTYPFDGAESTPIRFATLVVNQ